MSDGAATGLVLRDDCPELKEKRNGDGGAPHNALATEIAELVQVDLEDRLAPISIAIDP
jgi:hypothetical protein